MIWTKVWSTVLTTAEIVLCVELRLGTCGTEYFYLDLGGVSSYVVCNGMTYQVRNGMPRQKLLLNWYVWRINLLIKILVALFHGKEVGIAEAMVTFITSCGLGNEADNAMVCGIWHNLISGYVVFAWFMVLHQNFQLFGSLYHCHLYKNHDYTLIKMTALKWICLRSLATMQFLEGLF